MNLKGLHGWISENKEGRLGLSHTGHTPLGGLCVPLFVYPSSEGLASWSRVASTICGYNLLSSSFVVINPDNGDFGMRADQLAHIRSGTDSAALDMVNPDFVKACRLMESSNIQTLGYVYTNYGARPLELVRNRIELYKMIYKPDGIVLDEMARERGLEEYYSSLDAFVKKLGMRCTVGNPGTAVAESYVKTVDTLIVYENDGYPDFEKIVERTFSGKYPPEKFGLVLHSLNSYSSAWVKNATKCARYLYLTRSGKPNPYDLVTEYLDSLAHDLSGE